VSPSEFVHGVGALKIALDKLAVSALAASVTIVKRSEAVVEGNIKKTFTEAHKSGSPTPSRPGTPPAVITGTLRRSITSSPVTTNGLAAMGRVYPTAVYSRIQELGGGALPARPYMAPGYEASRPEISAIASAEWAKATRG